MSMMRIAAAVFAVAVSISFTVFAQRGSREMPGFPDGPGKDTLLAKCFQCHGPSMWMTHRQDRRAWESALYRMVGRGALWTEAEIQEMADYLGTVYGKGAK